jgi:dienelactone hydrolase
VALDTVEARWAQLKPHVKVYGERSPARPAVLLFHGCGGLRPHLPRYAQAAVERGWTAFVVDSYASRGWSRAYALSFVCTGARLWGRERAGDVLAAAWGVAHEGWADPGTLALAGWSHGSWAVMDLMTMPLTTVGEAGLANPTPAPLDGLKGAFLVYPYGGFGALSRLRPWRRTPKVLGVVALRDHVTSAADTQRVFSAAQRAGAETTLVYVDGTHSFDESVTLLHIRYDDAEAAANVARFGPWLDSLR